MFFSLIPKIYCKNLRSYQHQKIWPEIFHISKKNCWVKNFLTFLEKFSNPRFAVGRILSLGLSFVSFQVLKTKFFLFFFNLMYSLVSLLSGIYPFHAMHSLLVMNYLPKCTYHLIYYIDTILSTQSPTMTLSPMQATNKLELQ